MPATIERTFHSKASEVELKMPKLRKQIFETAITERYKHRETSIEEGLMATYLAGVSVRRLRTSTKPCGATGSAPAPSAS
ncbi:MAG: hypothetical protein CME40_05870 [Haliea sp.]|nr:hypothetical protein [Haliea sp.]